MFIEGSFAGEVNINNVVRSAMQCGTIGYWIDEARAGKSYMSEAVLVVSKYAFEELGLHRMEICIIPRNHNSRRVMEKLGIREEGLAERFLEINGVWEDHVRYGFTVEEWNQRRDQLNAEWLQ
jgi:ribosomal-protein-alanine N-acetyltransferase